MGNQNILLTGGVLGAISWSTSNFSKNGGKFGTYLNREFPKAASSRKTESQNLESEKAFITEIYLRMGG